ncbi:phage tail protein [Liquorilactobacillus satsumensis]|uniref:phage tail protein n=1 Tax=Lactobacillaceae TaxID=33958 RepID=UPI0021C38C88|nr:phage tail protein [Liquorilactobacillus satsumensis]MCP9313702.1 phage tail protein [Liquorilactobacillus satsumensis]MCP9360843.1 phage tail protein [Liquorilactobacillus satsumensis]
MAEKISLKSQVEGSKFVYVGFNPADEVDSTTSIHDPLIIGNSSDAVNWNIIQQYDDELYLRDPDIVKINGYYWIIGTLKLFRTLDFVSFDTYPLEDVLNEASAGNYKYIWAPEFCQDKSDNSWHIVYSANDGNRGIYFADFDPMSGAVTNCFQKADVDCGSSIDPDITFYNDIYYMWLSSARLFTSDSLMGHYSEVATNIIEDSAAKWYEAPEMMIAGDYAYLYQDKIDNHVSGVNDSGYMVYRVARVNNLTNWSEEEKVSCDVNMRHGSFLYNDNVYVQFPTYDVPVDDFLKMVKVKSIGSSQVAPLSCILWDTFQLQWAQNSTYQLQFTAYDDGSVSFDLLSAESSIYFDGQEYIVKQCEPDYSSDVNVVQITATHVYSEIQYVRQYSTKSGTLTYTPQQVLEFYLGTQNTENRLGFSYSVFGDFPKQQITDLGNNSGKDMLSQILSTWTNAIIYPDNRVIRVYTPDAFYKSFGRRIGYLYNTKEIKMTIDSTSLGNRVKCYGKQQENNDDNSTVKYYFDPFFVQDESSISTWGLHPMDDINDERFTSADSMKTYAQSQLITEPLISIETTYLDNEKPIAGESRHLEIKTSGFETDVSVIGFTWYPFSKGQNTVLEFDNLPASILNTQSLINNKIRTVQLLAQQALNKASTSTTAYLSNDDPQNNSTIRTGDIWVKPLTTSTTSTATEGS